MIECLLERIINQNAAKSSIYEWFTAPHPRFNHSHKHAHLARQRV
jgi:hypothetical protein